MNIGAFAVVSHLSGKGEKYQNLEDLAGLGKKQPLTAAMFTIYLLSLIGVPLTAGFFGKFYIFKAALESHLVWLTVLGLLNSAVGAYYYLRILVTMYMHEPGEGASNVKPLAPEHAPRASSARRRHAVPGHFPELAAGIRQPLGSIGEVGADSARWATGRRHGAVNDGVHERSAADRRTTSQRNMVTRRARPSIQSGNRSTYCNSRWMDRGTRHALSRTGTMKISSSGIWRAQSSA